jgi:hypothetical protein
MRIMSHLPLTSSVNVLGGRIAVHTKLLCQQTLEFSRVVGLSYLPITWKIITLTTEILLSPPTVTYDYMGSRAYNEETVTAARAGDYYAYGQGPSVSRTGDTSVNARAGTYLDEARASGEENYPDSRGAPRSPAANTSNDEKPGSDLDERGTKPTRNKAQWRYPS